MDEADMADLRIQQMIADGMERARKADKIKLPVTGFCYWCSEAIVGRTFCSRDCSDDFAKDQAARKRNGT